MNNKHKHNHHNTDSIMVTGGAGFIGANFVYYWLKQHPNNQVIVLDALTYAGNRASLNALNDHPNFHFVQGNIGDQALIEQLLVQYDIDTIVNFAAESHVDRSITGPDAFIESNIVGTHALLKAARQIWLDQAETRKADHRFHHVSTDEVYGSLADDAPAFTETHIYAPNSPYSASKASSDHLVRAYHHTFGLNVTTSNCSNNYGPYQFPEKLIPLFLSNILYGKSLPVYGTGKNIRDWLYVDDHARGIEMIIHNGTIGEVYNIGGNNEWSNLDIIYLLCDTLDQKFANSATLRAEYPNAPALQGKNARSLIRYVEDRAGHDWRYAIDAGKINQQLGYVPQETFESGIIKTINWYLDNRDWWEALLAKK